MSAGAAAVLDAYSHGADSYDGSGNARSCWGVDTERIAREIAAGPLRGTVMDVGCGTGGPLRWLAGQGPPGVRWIGVEPAEGMRARAAQALAGVRGAQVRAGSFEALPAPDASVDYLFSINAFHWTQDVPRALAEMRRVLASGGAMDHYFAGRDVGREFVRATTPVFLRHMGARRLLEAAKLRRQFTVDSARAAFAGAFGANRVEVRERYDTFHDTVEGHLGWWIRIEGQLVAIPAERRAACEREVREAIARLDEGEGVPYTKHTLHVRVRAG